MKTKTALIAGFFVLTAAAVRAGGIYDFESGAMGWTAAGAGDGFARNNFGAPAQSSAKAHAGSNSLASTLSFSDQESYGINDAMYSRNSLPMDLSTTTGVSMYVYVTQGTGNGNPAYPIIGRVYLKTGAGWTFYEGADTTLKRGQWTKLVINFGANAAFDSSHVAATVADTNQVQEIGVHIYGSKYDSGTCTFYLDSVQSGLGDDVTAPSAPASPSASDAASGNRINLSWTASGASDLDHYNIYRSTFTGALSTKMFVKSSTANATVADISVVGGIPYYYQITAVDKSSNESSGSSEVNATPSGASTYTATMKGMTYASFLNTQYSGVDSKSSLDDLAGTGANYVSLIVTQYMADASANSIAAGANTPSDAAVVQAITDIHNRGMKVMLKPHVDVTGGSWRGAITPSDANAWFTSYNTFITHYAQIADDNNVEMFVVGTELKTMTDKKLTNWTAIIDNVKTIYNNPGRLLTYAANANTYNDEFSQIEFWGQLDYVGLNIYYPLTNSNSTTVDGLKKAWSMNKNNEDPLQSIFDWSDYTGKSLVITEIGYQSADGTNTSPNGVAGSVDTTEQDEAYQAAFAAFNYRSWVQGLFWWMWDPNPNIGGSQDTDFTPQEKPAFDTVKANYGGETLRSFYDFESGVQSWIDGTLGVDNFGTPATASQGGSLALRYPLNLNNKDSGLLKDTGYVEPSIPKDMSGYKGLKASVLVDTGGTISNSNPVSAVIFVQTGSGFGWYQSSTFRNLTPGRWRDITLDFSSSESFAAGDTGTNKVVQNTTDIRRIGVSISGGSGSSGSTFFYVDNVGTKGSGTIMGLSLNTTTYSFGTIAPQTSTVAVNAIQMENSGNTAVTYALKCSSSTPNNWGPSTSAAGDGIFVLDALFNSARPAVGDFSDADDALTLNYANSSATKFAGDQTGTGVAAAAVRNLWFMVKPPNIASAADRDKQTITVSIQAQ